MTEVGSQRSEVTPQRKASTKPMNKKIMFLSLCSLLLALAFPPTAPAQHQDGWLAARPPAGTAASPMGRDLFWREFGALSYVEGKNFTFEYRTADNKLNRLTALADELVHLKVDVIIAGSMYEAQAAKKATKYDSDRFL